MALATASALVIAIAQVAHSEPAATSKTAAVDHDGPFGIAMGETLEDLGPVQKTGNGVYHVLRPARPNEVLNFVSVVAFPTLGVCKILAVGDINQEDQRGSAVKSTVDRLSEALSTKYGTPQQEQDCQASDTECSDYWTIQLHEGQAHYRYLWDLRSAQRADKIAMIQDEAMALNSVRTIPRVTYFAANDDACVAAMQAASGASL